MSVVGVVSKQQSSGRTHASSFDFNSWEGLARLLSHARAADMDDDTYQTLRDTVLLYARSGGDNALRQQLEKKAQLLESVVPRPPAASHRAGDAPPPADAPEPAPEKSEHPALRPLAPARPLPSFARSAAFPSGPRTAAKKPVQTPLPASAATPPVAAAVPAPPAAHTPPRTEDKKAHRPASAPHTSDTDAAPASRSAASSDTLLPKIEELHPSASAPVSDSEYRARIAHIKQSVAQHVGNPVAIVDTDNTVGRAYMTALVGALKALGGGTAAERAQALSVLEKEYATLLELDAARDAQNAPPEAGQDTASVSHTRPEMSSSPTPSPSASPQQENNADTPPPSPAVPPPSRQQSPPPAVAPPPPPPPAPPTPSVAAPPVLPEKEAASEKSTAQPAPPAHRLRSLADMPDALATPPVRKKKETPADTSALSAAPAVTPQPSSPPSRAARPPSKQPQKKETPAPKQKEKDAPLPAAASPAVEDAPPPSAHAQKNQLVETKVTAALEQLLGDWYLFGASGFLGTGPSGSNHPLYKRIAPLHMASVLAGRFEGATSETVRTLKDYVNAWRDEQGIAYVPGETFEHYLRRVVTRILARRET